MKAKHTWDNILSFSQELSSCLLLLESKSDTFKRRRMSRIYSLYVPSQDVEAYKDGLEANAPGTPVREVMVMKDAPGLDDFNYREKSIVLSTQTCYVLFLVSINLGDWDSSCLIIQKLDEYFTTIITNKEFIKWSDVSDTIVDPTLESIRKKLEQYPNFEFISPLHYSENNILKLTIEGEHAVSNTDCEAFDKLQKYSKLIMRLLFRWMFNCRFSEVISKRFKLQDFGLDCYKIQSVSSIVRFMTDFTECLKNDFFRILHKIPLDRQLTIIEEISKIMSPTTTQIELRQLIYLSTSDVHLDEMKKDFRAVLNPVYFSDFIQSIINAKLFTLSSTQEKEIEERKEKLLGTGLEVLRFRVDSGNGQKVAQAGLVKQVCYFQTGNDFDIFAMFGKTFKKYSLYKCLFNRNRQINGFKLLFDDLIEPKFGVHNEGEITPIDDHALKDRPLPLRIIYKTMFSSKFKESPIDKFSSSMNDLAFSLFENKDVIQLDMENLVCIAAHRTYPLIFAACRGGDILVIWSQTMRVIAHLHGAKNHIVKIVISPSGDRVVGIDSHGHVIIWRFNLLSKKINVESYIKNSSAMDLCFVNDSSLFAVLSKEGVSLEDMLTGSTLASNHLTECSGNWIHFLPLTQRLLVVNAKRRLLSVIDPITKAIINENPIDCTTSELTCSITNKVGSVVCLGTQEGEVILVNARSLSPIITYHPFESNTLGNLGLMKDRKLRMPVSFMNLEDYLVAVSSGGSVTIVTKI